MEINYPHKAKTNYYYYKLHIVSQFKLQEV